MITAELKVTKFVPGSISLKDGTLTSATEFEDVPYVRFRKQLSARGSLLIPGERVQSSDIAIAKEHTVLIIRADALLEFLGKFEIRPEGVRRFE